MSTFKVDVADSMLLPEGIFFHYVTLRCESFVFMCEGSARPIFIVKSVTAILIFFFQLPVTLSSSVTVTCCGVGARSLQTCKIADDNILTFPGRQNCLMQCVTIFPRRLCLDIIYRYRH